MVPKLCRHGSKEATLFSTYVDQFCAFTYLSTAKIRSLLQF